MLRSDFGSALMSGAQKSGALELGKILGFRNMQQKLENNNTNSILQTDS